MDKRLTGESGLNSVSPDIVLVQRAREGDEGAFSELVRSYQRRAVSLAYRLLGNVEDASDVSQDAFVRAYRSLDQLEDPGRFGGWFLRIVSNLSLNFRRSRKSREALSLDHAAELGLGVRNPQTGRSVVSNMEDDDAVIPGELRGVMREALSKLPEKQRLALVLFSIEGMPQKDVAEVLECSVELVKWNVFQARRKLKDALHEYL